MSRDVNRIRMDVGGVIARLTERIGMLERENAVLREQLSVVAGVLTDEQWETIAGEGE